MADLAPVLVFVYSRKEKTKECLDSLSNAENSSETDLYIFSDGSKSNKDFDSVNAVRDFIDSYDYKFKSVKIIKSKKNKGLANSIISGVTEVINEFGKVIVVEDDLIVSKDFLSYMNNLLIHYGEDNRIGSISAYTYPITALKTYPYDLYFLRKGECWGWATWKDVWNKVDWNVSDYRKYYYNLKRRKQFDYLEHGLDKLLILQHRGKADSWAVRWVYYLFCNDLLTVYPSKSRTRNIGLDGTGTNCGISYSYNSGFTISLKEAINYPQIQVDEMLERQVSKYSSSQHGIHAWIVNRAKKLI